MPELECGQCGNPVGSMAEEEGLRAGRGGGYELGNSILWQDGTTTRRVGNAWISNDGQTLYKIRNYWLETTPKTK